MASPDHQVGALFEALDEGVLMVPSKSIGYFFAISSCPEVRCAISTQSGRESLNEKNLKGFKGCHVNALIESFKMSPHSIGLR